MPCRLSHARGLRRAVRPPASSGTRDDNVARDLECLVADAERAHARRLLPDILAQRAEVELQAGRWDSARTAAAASLEVARETAQRSPHGLLVLALIEAAQGSELECRRHVTGALLCCAGGGATPLAYADSVLGLLELGLGNVEAAIAHLEPLTASGANALPADEWAPNLIEAYVRARRAGDAMHVLAALQAEAESSIRHTTLATAARCRGLVGRHNEFEHAFRVALDWHDDHVDPFERARTELCFGERLRRSRRRRDARAYVESALQVFEQLNALPWANRARRELDCGRDRPAQSNGRLSTALTAAEQRVAMLAARGYTNREAAASLFISPKTVEFHLGRVYAKLGIRSRAELGRLWLMSIT